MTIEDRIRRVLADAVAEEPPLRGTPLEAATRSRRGRPLLAGVIAMVLVLAAVVALAAVRGQRERGPVGPTPTTTTPADSGKAWKTFTDSTGHLRFRYPPDWALHRQPKRDDSVVLVPPEDAGRPIEQAGFQLRVDLDDVFWVGEMWFGTTTRGRLPNGQAYLLEINAPPAALNNQGWGCTPSTGAATAPATAAATAVRTACSSATVRPRLRRGTATARSPTRSSGR